MEIKFAKGLNDQLRASNKFHTNNNNNNQKKQQNKKTSSAAPRLAKKWEIVMDPTEFDSLFEASWFYIFGKEWQDCSDYFMLLVVIVGFHTLVVGGACYFYMRTLLENERIGIMPEVLTPPATPAMRPAQPQQP